MLSLLTWLHPDLFIRFFKPCLRIYTYTKEKKKGNISQMINTSHKFMRYNLLENFEMPHKNRVKKGGERESGKRRTNSFLSISTATVIDLHVPARLRTPRLRLPFTEDKATARYPGGFMPQLCNSRMWAGNHLFQEP